MQVWILTFNRPRALTRQILTWGRAGFDVHVFSNHPNVSVETEEALSYLRRENDLPGIDPYKIVYNHIAHPEATAYCARSWNAIFIKAFIENKVNECVFVQDDTDISSAFPAIITQESKNFDFIWGPAGDTFFYMKKEVLKTVGWFDERYLACYCGDADFMLRVWKNYDQSKLSIEETHDWGWIHNPIGIRQGIRWDIQSKAIDASYENQHEEQERKYEGNNYPLEQSQHHFKKQWEFMGGNGINGIGPLKDAQSPYACYLAAEQIDWYPWATKKLHEKEEKIQWINS